MKAADAKILAADLIALNALTNASYVSNHGVQEAARLAGIILDLATQIEALEGNGVMAVTVTPMEAPAWDGVEPQSGSTPVKKKRGRPPKTK